MSDANNIRAGLARIVTSETEGLALLGSHTYRVEAVSNGRCDLTPIESRMMPLAKVDQWLGGGAVVTPQVGTLCCVEFRDLRADRPIITRFQPLRVTGGAPAKIALAATEIDAGGTEALAKAAPINTWAAAVKTAITGLGGTVAALSDPSTTILKGA